MADSFPILIVGAGPTGLNLALRLARHGVPFRIIDRHRGPAEASRALAVHARTLEFYRQLGLAEAIVARGTKIKMAHVLEAGKEAAHFSFAEMGEGLSPFPFILDFPQDEHERFLVETLAAQGVTIEWDTELRDLRHDADGVDVVLVHGEAEQRGRVAWLCGCDGGHSRVRQRLGIAFEGGTYQHLYYVADVKLSAGNSDALYLAMGADIFSLRMPARKGAMCRLIGFAPQRPAGVAVTFEDVRADAERLLAAKVEELNWFSTYRVEHRVAAAFRAGRCFLAGDAGHVHSPVGGQGMNTGIGDAANLSWKLAQVVQGRADAALLDSYERERIAFARRLVATTDRAFSAIVSRRVVGTAMRKLVMPRVMPLVTRFAAGRRLMFRTVSQIEIAYPDSTLSAGKAGRVAGGDRLPWVPGADVFAPLATLDWQVHVHGACTPAFADACQSLGLTRQVFAWRGAARDAGYAQDAAYLVRPDGHVALALAEQDTTRLGDFVRRHGLRFGALEPSKPFVPV